MGTTVTTNLSLIKPDEDEYIRANLPTFPGWAVQNGSNCDTLDSLYRHTNASWTPSWTGDVSNPTLGAGGFVEGKYLRLYPRMVIGFFRIFAGAAGFAAGSSQYRFSLPVAPCSEITSLEFAVPIGKAFLLDNDTTANATNGVVMYEISTGLAIIRTHGGDSWRNNNPFTIAQNDRVSGYFVYPTSAP